MTTNADTTTPLEISRPHAGVTVLWLNRPHKHNAMTQALIAELHDTLGTLAKDDKTQVLVLAGRGKSFCSGADLNYMKSMVEFSHEENVDDACRFAAMLQALHQFPKPVIAALHGNVFAGATGLAACSDIVIAADDTRFCVSEVRLGLVPAVISPYVVARIGAHQARRYFLTAEVFAADAAMHAGLVHRCVPAGSLMNEVMDTAMQLLNNAPRAMTTTKNLINYLVPVPASREITDYTAALIARVRTGAEAQGGLQAFLDKKAAPWLDDPSPDAGKSKP
ncbi:MAG: enoyl-CoA hydratase-related protein [Pseudohongiella sp.]|uniref:enoyl-CoA hydratase-related protein n=1 Tax=Pseudohongiella sp. TaxID=1979412 RepID=UPI0034A09FCD